LDASKARRSEMFVLRRKDNKEAIMHGDWGSLQDFLDYTQKINPNKELFNKKHFEIVETTAHLKDLKGYEIAKKLWK
jgi:hypothetical protein